ncbi:MAG: cytochrome b [Rubrimonas sp.]
MTAPADIEPAGAPVRHHPLRRALHWAMAIIVIGMVPAGIYFTDFDNRPAIEAAFGPGSFDHFYNLHKAVGIVALALALWRIWARRRHPDPAYAVPLTEMQAQMSRLAHRLIYVLLVLTPLLGWAGVSAFPAPLPFFGLFEVPKILPPNRELAEVLLFWHKFCALSLAALAIVHIGAALHHRARGDGVFQRMGLRWKDFTRS